MRGYFRKQNLTEAKNRICSPISPISLLQFHQFHRSLSKIYKGESKNKKFCVQSIKEIHLKKKLGQYILGDLDLEQLDVQLGYGTLQLTDLALNVDYINQKVMNPSLTAPLIPATASLTTNEDLELSMAIATYIHSSSMDERPLHPNAHKSILDSKPVYWINSSENSSTPNNRGLTRGPASPLGSSSSRWSYKPAQVGYNGWDVPEGGPSNSETQQSIHSTCVICLDAPIEGACIPCGHLSRCMSCLIEIQGKKWGCPV